MEAQYFDEAEQPKPAIYSRQALIGFSAVFSALAGGILVFQSLRTVGQPAAARHALWMSIGFLAFAVLLGQVLPMRVPGIGLALGYAWGLWLSHYVAKRVPQAASYPRKPIGKALGICLAISALVIAGVLWATYYGG